jgi:hypothetical protein
MRCLNEFQSAAATGESVTAVALTSADALIDDPISNDMSASRNLS